MNDPATLYLIDGHSLTFKAYYAVRGLTSPTGAPTGAVFGFLRMLLKFMDDLQPAHLAIVFDTGKPTFRKELYAEYKANREAPPPDFGQQMIWIYRMIRAMGLAVYEKEGYEADDLIGTMCEAMKQAHGRAVIISADKDLLQLVNDSVIMLRPGANDVKKIDEAGVVATIGVKAAQVVDWLALMGDASDNIPGVPGIGEKTAAALLAEFGSLDALLERREEIGKPKLRQALLEHGERAKLARQLATIKRDVPFDWEIEACRMPENLWPPEAVAFAAELGFQSILKERGIAAPPRAASSSTTITITSMGTGTSDGGQIEIGETTTTQVAPETHYEAVTDLERLKAWAAPARGAAWIAIDTETTGTDAMQDALVGISLSCREGEAIYIPVGHQEGMAGMGQLALDAVRAALAPLLAGGEGMPRLTGHHAKFDWKILRRHGFEPAPPAFDSMIASYLLDPDKLSGHGLKALGRELAGVEMTPITELIGRGAKQISMAEVAIADAAPYACRDADVTLRLTQILSARLDAVPALRRLMDELEMPLSSVLLEMELGGFNLDVPVLRTLGVEVDQEIQRLTRAIWETAGHPFNIGSTKQVAQVLFEELKLKTGRQGKTGFSTDEEELERLAPEHPIPRLILDYRGLEKLKSTYIEALPKLVNPKTGRIHTSFNQTIAATGRLSSTDPNLQNIPIRTRVGRAIRRAFVADGAGQVVLKADYSQIELRILAHISGDGTLCRAYHEGRDIHRQTAGEIFGVAPEGVTSDMRAQAKIVNFGIIYGMSAHGLAQQLGIGRVEAARFIERYFSLYPGVRRWIDAMLTEARRRGWVETLLGRRRLVPDLTAKNSMIRGNAERIAVNTPIQGTCADMIKRAMIKIQAKLAGEAPGARMICQVHDELVFSVPGEVLEATEGCVRREMANALPLSVPVIVDVSHGPNWAECK